MGDAALERTSVPRRRSSTGDCVYTQLHVCCSPGLHSNLGGGTLCGYSYTILHGSCSPELHLNLGGGNLCDCICTIFHVSCSPGLTGTLGETACDCVSRSRGQLVTAWAGQCKRPVLSWPGLKA